MLKWFVIPLAWLHMCIKSSLYGIAGSSPASKGPAALCRASQLITPLLSNTRVKMEGATEFCTCFPLLQVPFLQPSCNIGR